ncbi:MAG: DUF177 domain-containing protein [Sphingomonas sp.]
MSEPVGAPRPDTVGPEFSRPERLDMIGEQARTIVVEATPDEAAALAARFGLLSVAMLRARCAVHREARGVVVTGLVEAELVQACAATGDPLAVAVREPLALLYVVETDNPPADELELTPDALDIVPLEGGLIDLGEAAAETMALALDPFARAPHADEALRAAGVLREDEAGPFGVLAGLRDMLSGKIKG